MVCTGFPRPDGPYSRTPVTDRGFGAYAPEVANEEALPVCVSDRTPSAWNLDDANREADADDSTGRDAEAQERARASLRTSKARMHAAIARNG